MSQDFSEPNNWPTENEVHLLFSTLENKPVGIDKHLQMSIIWNRFVSSSKKDINSDLIWKKLRSWYNLARLDAQEALPFSNTEEDFLLPAEIIPDYYQRSLTEEEKKNVDSSGSLKKYISVIEHDEEDSELKLKLKGHDKMKWFECPQYYKPTDNDINKKDLKIKTELLECSNSTPSEHPKILRQYGKAREVIPGTFVAVPSSIIELDDNADDESAKDDVNSLRMSKNEFDKMKQKRKQRDAKKELPMMIEEAENSTPAKVSKITRPSDSATLSHTRSRKTSGVISDSSINVDSEKYETCEDTKNSRRRASTRVSDTKSEKSKSRKSIPKK